MNYSENVIITGILLLQIWGLIYGLVQLDKYNFRIGSLLIFVNGLSIYFAAKCGIINEVINYWIK